MWQLDTFSTFLSRKHSYHRCIGRLRYVRVKRVEYIAPVYNIRPLLFATIVGYVACAIIALVI